MQKENESTTVKIIKQNHGGDEKQMDIILSPCERLVVEAPAGCGKTTTMVSKVAYLISNNQIEKNKKILALTFSVNAAYKMKKDISNKLPLFGLKRIGSPEDLNKYMYISNYHGLCRRIIALYGYLFDERLKDINNFRALNENDYKADEIFDEYNLNISEDEKNIFADFHKAVMECDTPSVEILETAYCNILQEKFFGERCITYNGYLVLAKKILKDNPELLRFYQKLYPMIIIDEFQDTNFLSWNIINLLISDNTKCFFMGDSLQRIYGFIGAIPNLLDLAQEQFEMKKLEMTTNYRFKNNPEMLLLDRNIRENARNIKSPLIEKNANISMHYSKTQLEECEWLVDQIRGIQLNDSEKTISVLVQQRGEGINSLIEELDKNEVDFFYALFSDEDEEYIVFHRIALSFFHRELELSRYGRVNKSLLNRVNRKIREYYEDTNRLIESLLMLVEVFFDRVCNEYRFLDNLDKIAFISDTFENRALKQNMDLIDSNLFISTVHGAKGLEWDYVFLPDFEAFCFPNYPSLCGTCMNHKACIGNFHSCKLDVEKIPEDIFLEELSVYYVAVTRVRKNLFFSASSERKNAAGKICNSKISCLAFLPGISIQYI